MFNINYLYFIFDSKKKKIATMQKPYRKEEFEEELDEIPFYLRASIQKIIDRKVAQRIDHEMGGLKDEIRAQLAD